jgi:hypothetical protein
MESRTQIREKRASLRLDAMFPVVLSSERFGDFRCMARNISQGGMFVESIDPLPLGCRVKVHFVMERNQGEIVAKAEIKNHYYLSYNEAGAMRSVVGMGVRFLSFDEGQDALQGSLARLKTIH